MLKWSLLSTVKEFRLPEKPIDSWYWPFISSGVWQFWVGKEANTLSWFVGYFYALSSVPESLRGKFAEVQKNTHFPHVRRQLFINSCKTCWFNARRRERLSRHIGNSWETRFLSSSLDNTFTFFLASYYLQICPRLILYPQFFLAWYYLQIFPCLTLPSNFVGWSKPIYIPLPTHILFSLKSHLTHMPEIPLINQHLFPLCL